MERNRDDLLFQAIIRQEFNTVETLLNDGAKFTVCDRDGNTVLILTSQQRQIGVLQLLIDHGCNVNETNAGGWTALHYAVNNGDLDTASVLINNNADVNLRTVFGRNSALHIAATKGYDNIVAALLSANAKVKLKNGTRRTPLHVAVEENHLNIVRLLLQAGSNPKGTDKFGKTPLISAIENNAPQIVNELLLADVSISSDELFYQVVENGQEEILQVLINYIPNINSMNADGDALIILASRNGYVGIVSALLDKGSDVDIVDRRGWNSLHNAAHYGHREVVNKLLQSELNQDCLTTDNGNSALHLAILEGHADIIDSFISDSFNLEMKNSTGQTALQLAVEENQIDCAIKLLEFGSDPNVENIHGEKLISCAIRQGNIELLTALLAPGTNTTTEDLLQRAIDTKQVDVVRMLLEHGGYLKIENDDGFKLLKSTLLNNFHPQIFQLLLKHGCKITATDEKGQSLLHFVTLYGHLELVEFLIKAGANVNHRTMDGNTPLHLAAIMGFTYMIDAFVIAGADLNIGTMSDPKQTPLMNAVIRNKTEFVKRLLELGCDPNGTDVNGIHLLSLATSQGFKDIEEALTAAGAKSFEQKVIENINMEVLRLVLKDGAYIESDDDLIRNLPRRDDFQWTALHHAVAHGKVDLCVRFLNVGADVNWVTISGDTPLHIAVANEQIELIEILVHYGADLYIKNFGGNIPIEFAVLWDKITSVKKMLECHSKIEKDTMTNVCDRLCLLSLAAKNSRLAMLVELFECGGNVNFCDPNGMYLLNQATILGKTEIVDILLSYPQIDLEAKDRLTNETPLIIATRFGYNDITTKLIKSKANPNANNFDGGTPLSNAVRKKDAQIVNDLISCGAKILPELLLLHQAVSDDQVEIVNLLIEKSDVNLQNEAGNTPLMITAQTGNIEIAKILLEHGASVNAINSVTESTILHEAIENIDSFSTFKEYYRFLDGYGVDCNVCIPNKDTPLFRAISLGREDVAMLLIQNGADLKMGSMVNGHECDNLKLALEKKLESVVKFMVLNGAYLPNNLFNDPWSLNHLARLKIRSHLPQINFSKSVKSLSLPDPMKKFLMYDFDVRSSQQAEKKLEDLHTVEKLLNDGVKFTARDRDGNTVLILASQQRQIGALRLLIDHGCNVNETNANGWTALHYAVNNGDLDAASILIKNNADINIRTVFGRNSALHIAVTKGYDEIVAALLSAKAKVKIKNGTKRTPLHVAVVENHLHIVRLLLQAGADVNHRTLDGQAPLHIAAIAGFMEVLRLVLNNGALIESEDDLGRNISKRDKLQWTALHHAVVHGNINLCERFLNVGADVNAAVISGETPLHYAAMCEHIELVEILVHYGAGLYIKNHAGYIPIEYAVLTEKFNSVKKLLECHSKIENDTMLNVCNKLSLLGLALENNRITMLEQLLEFGGDVNFRNSRGMYLLNQAIFLGRFEIVDILLSHPQIDVETKDSSSSETPLLIAVRFGYKDIITKLIKLKANPNAKNDEANITPLCYAVRKKDAHIVKELISCGAEILPQYLYLHQAVTDDQVEIVNLLIDKSDIHLQNEAGNTPLMITAQTGNIEIAKILLEHGASVNAINSVTESTILHEAVENIDSFSTFKEYYRFLDGYGVDCNVCIPNKDTPLFRAISLGREDVAMLLIHNGADLKMGSMVNGHECDNLKLALEKKLALVVKCMVLNGAYLPNNLFNDPWSLSHLARLKIRSHLPKIKFSESVMCLPLPISMKKFLMYDFDVPPSQQEEEKLENVIKTHIN
ncbi:uncharacterized protein LOC143912590 [Arctopsyche grandis]|uniref:uncharacterized protein LOC143912590 n=1 Tax=Arctopsyche grandis TaxID=121162 RepID=UPI00406D870D